MISLNNQYSADEAHNMDILEEYCQSIFQDSSVQSDAENNLSEEKINKHNSININGLSDQPTPCFEDPYRIRYKYDYRTGQSFFAQKVRTTTSTTAFICNKGGTGKTTACTNIAGWLASQKKRILVIDLDPQASATTGLGYKTIANSCSIADALEGIVTLSSLIQRTSSGVYLIPAQENLLLTERKMVLESKSVETLNSMLSQLNEHFDHILIDAPAGHGLLTLNAIVASDNIIVPIDSSVYAKKACSLLLSMMTQVEKIVGHSLNVAAVLIKEQPGFSLNRRLNETHHTIKQLFSESTNSQPEIFSIPYSPVCDRAAQKGTTLAEFAPLDRLTHSFKKVAKHLSSQHS